MFEWGILFLLSVLSLSEVENREVRIGLFQKELPDQVELRAAGDFNIVDGRGKKIIVKAAGNEAYIFKRDGGRVTIFKDSKRVASAHWVKIVNKSPGNTAFTLSTPGGISREYGGCFEIYPRKNQILAINIIEFVDYVAAVLPNEMPLEWPREALKAQAVVTRTYAQKNLGRHSTDGYDFCDLTHCQVYKGITKNYNAAKEVIRETAGEVLTYDGEIIETFYHSTCGGKTANNEDVWPGSQPLSYIRSQVDRGSEEAFCQNSPHFVWEFTIGQEFLASILKEKLNEGNILGIFQGIKTLEIDNSGRVKRIQIIFSRNNVELTGYEFYLLLGRRIGWHKLKSTRFSIEKSADGFRFIGKGLGHGLGMCQWGAKGRAEAGQSYQQILHHYFPGTELKVNSTQNRPIEK